MNNRYSLQKSKIYTSTKYSKEEQFRPSVKQRDNLIAHHSFSRKIVVNKIRNNQNLFNKTSYNSHLQYAGRESINKEKERSHPFSRIQRQKFIQQLNVHVFNDKPKIDKKSSPDHNQNNQRIQQEMGALSLQKSKTFRSVLSQRMGIDSVKKSNRNIRMKTQGNDQVIKQRPNLNRVKSKTSRYYYAYKEQQLILQNKIKKIISKTSKINTIEIQQKLKNNLNEIQGLQKKSIYESMYIHDKQQNIPFLETLQQKTIKEDVQNDHQILQMSKEELQLKNRGEDIELEESSEYSAFPQHTEEYYQRRLQRLTQQYFSDCQKIKGNKKTVYQNFRTKLATMYPKMKKHYTQFKIPYREELKDQIQERITNQKRMISQKKVRTNYNNRQNDVRASVRVLSNHLNSSHHSASNFVFQESKRLEQEYNELHAQDNLLKEIFKQAYFWSKTRNKFMTNKAIAVMKQERNQLNQQEKHLANIQKNLSFIKYMKSKTNRCQILNKKNKLRGSKIKKNEQNILSLQKEGSREQLYLKRCFDEVVQRYGNDIN